MPPVGRPHRRGIRRGVVGDAQGRSSLQIEDANVGPVRLRIDFGERQPIVGRREAEVRILRRGPERRRVLPRAIEPDQLRAGLAAGIDQQPVARTRRTLRRSCSSRRQTRRRPTALRQSSRPASRTARPAAHRPARTAVDRERRTLALSGAPRTRRGGDRSRSPTYRLCAPGGGPLDEIEEVAIVRQELRPAVRRLAAVGVERRQRRGVAAGGAHAEEAGLRARRENDRAAAIPRTAASEDRRRQHARRTAREIDALQRSVGEEAEGLRCRATRRDTRRPGCRRVAPG